MHRYLSVSIGTSPSEAKEVFFSDDAGLIELVISCVLARLQSIAAEPSREVDPSKFVTLH